jgi:hypothetical protein
MTDINQVSAKMVALLTPTEHREFKKLLVRCVSKRATREELLEEVKDFYGKRGKLDELKALGVKVD